MQYINLDQYRQQTDPFYFALEKHLLTLTGDFSFIWDVFPAVIVGKHQVIKNEVNLSYLKTNNIKLYRRPSGGGAVYSDEGCIKYTFIARNLTKDEMYYRYLTLIKNFLKETYNLDAQLSGRNDLVINSYKFSGNAYYQTKDGSVLHGTLLFSSDLEKMSQVLTPHQDKLLSKGVKSVKSRVINLNSSINITKEQFIIDFKNYLNHNERLLSKKEDLIIKKYIKEFNSSKYILGREPKYSQTLEKYYPFGQVIINFEAKGNKIVNLNILGDYFEKRDVEILEKHLLGQDLNNIVLNLDVNDFIDGMSNQDFINLLKG